MKADNLAFMILRDAQRFDAPCGCLAFALIVADIARRIDRVAQPCFGAALANCAVSGEARIVREQGAEIFSDAVAQVAGKFDPPGKGGFHIGVGDRDIAFRDDNIGRGVIGKLVGAQIALAEIGAHFAFGDDRPVIKLSGD